jgi:hypothetical protein
MQQHRSTTAGVTVLACRTIDAMKALGDIKSDITPEKVVMPGLARLVD